MTGPAPAAGLAPAGYAAWLRSAVQVAAPPALGFDARAAGEADLAALGLPPRPDAAAAPRLRALWDEMMRPPLAFVAPDLGLSPRRGEDGADDGPGAERPRQGRQPRAPRPPVAAVRSQVSRNWAGAVLSPNRGRRFARVIGRWRAPHVSAGSGPLGDGLDWKCSVWIGVDGFRLWHLGMPQIGTEHVVDPAAPGGQRVHVRWQWWLREGFSRPVFLRGLPTNPGDVVFFDLTVLDARTVLFFACNRGTGQCVRPMRVTLPPVIAWPDPPDALSAPPTGLPPEVEGSSAEWIIERQLDLPPPYGIDAFHPLADFGAVAFDGAALMEAAGGEPAAEVTIASPRLLRMVDRLEAPSRSALRVRTSFAATGPAGPGGGGGRGVRVEYLPAG